MKGGEKNVKEVLFSYFFFWLGKENEKQNSSVKKAKFYFHHPEKCICISNLISLTFPFPW